MDDFFSYILYVALIGVILLYLIKCAENTQIKSFMGNLFEDVIVLEKHFERMANIAKRESKKDFINTETKRKHEAVGRVYKYSATKVNELIRKYNLEYPKTFFSEYMIHRAQKPKFWHRIALIFVKPETVVECGEISEMKITYKRFRGHTYIIKTEMKIKSKNENKYSKI